jgi:hypothetical protein
MLGTSGKWLHSATPTDLNAMTNAEINTLENQRKKENKAKLEEERKQSQVLDSKFNK